MFQINDRVYIKKNFDNEFKVDKSRNYTIVSISKTINNKQNKMFFEKFATLNNGRQQIIYQYNIITKEKEFFIEKVPWYYTCFCG
jgi:hypothetical protein|tara:strand:+ start:153 stop:407 length:255 start_codon:yes stop_codon:yes gene_type:complete